MEDTKRTESHGGLCRIALKDMVMKNRDNLEDRDSYGEIETAMKDHYSCVVSYKHGRQGDKLQVPWDKRSSALGSRHYF